MHYVDSGLDLRVKLDFNCYRFGRLEIQQPSGPRVFHPKCYLSQPPFNVLE